MSGCVKEAGTRKGMVDTGDERRHEAGAFAHGRITCSARGEKSCSFSRREIRE